ncbi:MAG TPA: GNAT family protein [Thermoflexales bacterium]|nr:GNAT family protein [Thermoflexales bacterium]
MNTQLFKGEKVRLTALNPDKDAEVMSAWSHDADFLHRTTTEIAAPIPPPGYKKKIEEWMKDMDKNEVFVFGIRQPGDERLIGMAQIYWVEWPHGAAHFTIGIGKPEDRNKGLGSEATRLLLRYSFHELNLHRLATFVSSWNADGLRFLARFGFVEEFRRRESLYIMGQRYDQVGVSLLKEEWHDN